MRRTPAGEEIRGVQVNELVVVDGNHVLAAVAMPRIAAAQCTDVIDARRWRKARIMFILPTRGIVFVRASNATDMHIWHAIRVLPRSHTNHLTPHIIC